jgi:hypothetical protein
MTSTMTQQKEARAAYASDEIRPFKISFPDEALADLKRRIIRQHEAVTWSVETESPCSPAAVSGASRTSKTCSRSPGW